MVVQVANSRFKYSPVADLCNYNMTGYEMKKKFVVFLTLFSLFFGTSWAKENSPTDDLQPVLNDLVSVLADESLKGRQNLVERRVKIMQFIKGGFDFKEMAKRVLGKTWRDLNEPERNRFTELITKLLENVYIGRLEGYSGQAIEFDGEKVKGKRAQVTTLVENGNQKIPVHYIMKKSASKWMVYDINIEGISLVRNYQEQFKSILRKEGYEGLVAVIEQKNRSFNAEAP